MNKAKSAARRLLPESIWERVRLAKVRFRVKGYSRRWVRHRFGPQELDILLADTMGEVWYDKDWDSLVEIELLKSSQLRPGATVFDCGAHYGVVAAMLAHEVEGGKVVAVEGLPHNAAVAREIVQRNGITSVEVVNAAVSDKPGTLRFSEFLNGSIDDKGSITVEATTVDLLAEKYGAPSVLFIDVEGFELLVLDGAKETLKSRPDITLEVHVGYGLEEAGGSAQEVIDLLTGMEYELWAHDDLQLPVPRPLAEVPEIIDHRFFLTAIAR